MIVATIPPPSSSPSQTKHMINIQTERGIHMFGARKERERRTYMVVSSYF